MKWVDGTPRFARDLKHNVFIDPFFDRRVNRVQYLV